MTTDEKPPPIKHQKNGNSSNNKGRAFCNCGVFHLA